mgnify:CR=1 FL=1
MRVLQIINSFAMNRGGAERLARALHGRLRADGSCATLISLEACPTDDLECAMSLGFKSAYDPRLLWSLARTIRRLEQPVDIVHAHLFPASAHVAMLSALGLVNAPCVFTEHNTSNGRRSRQFGRLIDRAVYLRFDLIAAISEGVREALGKEYPWLLDRCHVVPNGVALRYHAATMRPSRRNVTVVSAGRMVAQKNYTAALKAIAQLDDLPVRYVILGEGPERGAIEKLAGRLGISDRVDMPGHVSDIHPYLAAADIFLMPSLWEGFGLAAVEAMNASLPMVVSDVPGLREVAGADGECACLVAPDDLLGLSNAIRHLACSPSERWRMGAAGFERSRQFGIERMIQAYSSCYEGLLARERTYA